MSNTVIEVEHLSKYYRLGQIGGGTLREDVTRWMARLRGKPNPLLKIGEADHDDRRGGEIWALRDVNFEVEEGEILGIIGGNGAGKSTLLKILSRITAPTSGRITLKGRVGSLLEVGTGFHPELTGRENIYLNGTILGMKRAEVDRKLEEIVEFAEMAKFIDTPVKRYSSGMTVRLAFAVAAHLEPELLIIDEVLAVGDAAFQKKCLGKMDDISKTGRTVLFVSHNMSSVKALCSRGLLLENGTISEIGQVSSVVEKYLQMNNAEQQSDFHHVGGDIYRTKENDNSKRSNSRERFCITRVQLFDSAGGLIQQARTWSYLKVRIHYSADEHVEKGSVVLSIQTKEGFTLMLCSTEPDSGRPLSLVQGESYVDCIFENWPLAEGYYQLGAGLAIPMREYLCMDDHLAPLITVGEDVYGSGTAPSSDRYLVASRHHWSFPE